MKLRLDTAVVFLLFLYVLTFATPAYCLFLSDQPIACYPVVSLPDDPPMSDYTPTHTVVSSGVAFQGTATVSTTTTI